ncbi:uncharacterized protein LOC128279069 [Anopheles cruzii]|uniref:uncharacterized protein LOC128279069 n=1 Tax=Anopheles cruzii TaxID=68878 RepID=UPI0022EC7120|nr:uncharacterized protein LOC128279069 [Anopheles cruzii]
MKCNFRYPSPVLLLALCCAGCTVQGYSSSSSSSISSDPHLFENRDGYIIGNYLQATDQDIRDFFWTGSGDGMPSSVQNPFERFPLSEDAIIKTATVVATVYIDRSGAPDGYDDLCIFDCPPGGGTGTGGRPGPGVDDLDVPFGDRIDNVTPTDRRFWLMTVIGGLYGRPDYPMLESRLAKLYRVAFARQQALHLGINSSASNSQQHRNNTLESMEEDDQHGPSRRTRRGLSPDVKPNSTLGLPALRTMDRKTATLRHGGTKSASTTTTSREHSFPASARDVLTNGNVVAYEQRQRLLRKRGGPRHKRHSPGVGDSGERIGSQVLPVPPIVEVIGADGPEGSGGEEQSRPQRSGGGPSLVASGSDKGAYSTDGRRKVRILIHNTTHLREDDRLSLTEHGPAGRENNRSGPAGSGFAVGSSNQLINQTEIIYSVFVGGLPVLATTAAEDMKLMSQDEMEHVLESTVYLKADPYLKEPQATPLIPSTQNGSGNVIALIGQNPSLFVVSCVAAVLLLVLCIGLFLLARGKRKHIVAMKKLESTQALVMPGTIAEELSALKTGESGSSRQPSPYPRDPSGAVGGRMAQKASPTIHFPLPPMTRPTSSSSSYSSDCSVYYPKRKQKHQHHHHHHHHQQQQHHELLDEKAVNLTSKMQKQFHLQSLLSPGVQENVYATVQKPPPGKKDHKRRRKYLGENRVGSLEAGAGGLAPPPPQRSPLTTTTATTSSASPSDRSFDDRQPRLVPGAYEPSETFNTDLILKHYLKRKPFGYGEPGLPVEALSRDQIRVLAEQYGGVAAGMSLDSGSIGSYLSMASVKSFPRCFVPEPLSRVLEPVTMTHLDQSDAAYPDGMKSSGADTAATSQYNTDTDAPGLARSQSDGADPGVVGPIVWQMHKKEMEEMTSPLRDPVVTRNRFEGLLEGAIQLYGDGPERDEEQKTSIPLPGVIRPVESRGKSAVVVRETSRASSATIRPVTAAPGRKGTVPAREPQLPRSPNAPLGGRAWASGTHSPMVRPMSAGPFHSPQSGPPLGLEIARVTAPQTVLQSTELSTAPLLDNIMHELRRYRAEQ